MGFRILDAHFFSVESEKSTRCRTVRKNQYHRLQPRGTFNFRLERKARRAPDTADFSRVEFQFLPKSPPLNRGRN